MSRKEPSNLIVTDLSFGGIKENLINYLKSQDQFRDYDFSGSNLNLILDILSYNTHYNSFYTNVVANESFLDSAVDRNSVVSHAKMIGYIPHSRRASRATFDILCRPVDGSVSVLTIPRRSPFVASVDGVNYIFYTLQDYVSTTKVTVDSIEYFKFEGVTAYEGVIRTSSFIRDVSNDRQRFVVPVSGIDTDTFQVIVQKSATNIDYTVYQPADSIVEVNSESNVYWIQEVDGGLYEIYFGDGVIGSGLEDGNIVLVSYVQTNGSIANFAKNFIFSGVIADSYNNTITITNSPSSFGGSESESILSVKKLAPLNYQAQNRTVTRQDYEAILLRDHPSIDSIYVWGGEDHIPPQYGKVFISIKPKEGEVISDYEKEQIVSNILESKGIVTIIPELVEPDYIYLGLRVNAFYNPAMTNYQPDALRLMIRESIEDYGKSNLEKFDRKYYESVLLRAIDETDRSLVGSSVDLTLRKSIPLNTLSRANYTIEFSNPIHPSKTDKLPSVRSGLFAYFDPYVGRVVECYLKDDGYGTIRIYTTVSGSERVVHDQYFSGSVNYERGVIELRRFRKDSNEGQLTIFVKPNKEELATNRNQILLLDDENIDIKVYPKSAKL